MGAIERRRNRRYRAAVRGMNEAERLRDDVDQLRLTNDALQQLVTCLTDIEKKCEDLKAEIERLEQAQKQKLTTISQLTDKLTKSEEGRCGLGVELVRTQTLVAQLEVAAAEPEKLRRRLREKQRRLELMQIQNSKTQKWFRDHQIDPPGEA